MSSRAWLILGGGAATLTLLVRYVLPDAAVAPPPRAQWTPKRITPLSDVHYAHRPSEIAIKSSQPRTQHGRAPALDNRTADTTIPHAEGARALSTIALPNCSVVFFHHLEKTGGTTVRSIMQRHAQLGQFDLISFVNRFDKLQLQIVLHRLWTLLHTPGGLTDLRLGVEIHIGGHLNHPYFLKYTLPDLLMLRQHLRAAGCRCHLVTLLRHPLLQHLSWHFHFVNHRVPLCFWSNPPDCQSRLALGLTCHDSPHIPALTGAHESALRFMWNAFDLVGLTEMFDEFVVMLAQMVGLPHAAFRMQVVAQHTLAQQKAQREWTSHSCDSLLRGQTPEPLQRLIAARMAKSKENAAGHQRRQGRSSTGGKPGTMECRGYGPCVVPSIPEHLRGQDAQYEEEACAAVNETQVLERMCGRLALDERIYFQARERFESQLRRIPRSELDALLTQLKERGEKLQKRAEEQAITPRAHLESQSGVSLQRAYRRSSGGGAPWVVDETAPWYQAHERARYSCHNCSGDVVPEKDLVGCWPLWGQFAPDELRLRCSREWTDDPGHDRARSFREGELPMPCWRTCWEPMRGGDGERRCSAPCPQRPLSALEWRRQWDAALTDFWRTTEGAELSRVTSFVVAKPMRDFIWNIY